MKQETGRLKEILHVLNQHKVTQGIDPEKLCSILEDLGPTYVKLGQIMSMRSDILPEKYCHELARLRTDVKPMSFDEIWEILNKELTLINYFRRLTRYRLGVHQSHRSMRPF